MADYNAARVGQSNGAGDAKALFMKVFPGEIIGAFDESNVTIGRFMTKTISSGKSAQFPLFGTANAEYHTPGAELDGLNNFKFAEKVISIDSRLVSHEFVDELDEAMAHYDTRSYIARKMGHKLAIEADKRMLQLGVLGARSATIITGGNGGSVLTGADFSSDGLILAKGIFSAGQAMDEKDVPEDGRYFFCKPAQYNLLVQETTNINKDFGGIGAWSDGKVVKIDNFEIVKTNHLPTSNIAAVTGENNTYSGDFSTTVGLAAQREALGTVKLMDLAVRSDYIPTRLGDMIVAQYAMGHGFLRPECLVEFKTS